MNDRYDCYQNVLAERINKILKDLINVTIEKGVESLIVLKIFYLDILVYH